jgi:thiopeptide-type bacteriocin biosynthesis protein
VRFQEVKAKAMLDSTAMHVGGWSSLDSCLPSRSTWLYVRIYCPAAMSDDIVLHLMRPLEMELRAREYITRFFFIRYLEGGYHLRLRFYGERQALSGPVRARLNEEIARYFSERGYAVNEPLDWGPDGMDDPHWQPLLPPDARRPTPSYEYDRYDPEVERYGGQQGLLVSEEHFQQSSYTAFAVIEHERAGHGPRQNAALLLMEAAAEAFGMDDRQKLDAFGRQFSYWVPSLWVTAEHLHQFAGEYDRFRSHLCRLLPTSRSMAAEHRSRTTWHSIVYRWRAEMSSLYHQLTALERRGALQVPPPDLLLSYLHMLCNRLGIFPREEACLAYLLHRSYAEQLGLPPLDATAILEGQVPSSGSPTLTGIAAVAGRS